MQSVSQALRWLRSTTGTFLAVRAAVGNPDSPSLFTTKGGVRRAWNWCRASPLERRQATGDPRHDVLSGDLGSTPVVARDGSGVWD